MHTEKVHIYER